MYVKAIFAKMNVISRTEAVANATRCGLISFDATFLPV
jgi:DNA-binding CsgD family transcriptional regulator